MADEKYKYFDVQEQGAGSGASPVPGLAYRAAVLGTTGAGTLRIYTQWGTFDAELNYNAPAAGAKEAIVMQRNGRWIVLGVYR